MSSKTKKTFLLAGAAILIAIIILVTIFRRDNSNDQRRPENIAAVSVASIEKRPIELRRTFSGALEARSKFVVAPKVTGRILAMAVDISDTVQRGDTVVILDGAEFTQDVNQAEADLAVAQANLAEAESSLEIALRENQRTTTLVERGIASESEFDTAQAALLSQEAQVKVAEAQVTRASSALQSARIRLSYTEIAADWNEGNGQRVVAERYLDEGETVSANEPLLLVVDLSPITAVIFVTERDYGLLSNGLEAQFTADSFPGRTFVGRIERISPVFRESSRQARVELSIENDDGSLRPGMFVRADIALDRSEAATVIPYSAITRRADKQGVFLVNEQELTVSWQPVEVGIRSGEWIEIKNDELTGRVVTLGQHLIDDGSTVTIPSDNKTAAVQ